MSGEVRLRRATLADAPAAAEVWVRARHQAAPAIPPAIHSDGDMRRWFSEVAFVESDVWIAEADDGLVVGVMAIKDGRIEQLYVDALWTGRGIGSRLIQLSKELHPDGLELWAFVSNARTAGCEAIQAMIRYSRCACARGGDGPWAAANSRKPVALRFET